MEFIDTHTHIYQTDFKNDIDEVISKAKSVGITKLLLPNVDEESIDPLHLLCDKHPGICFPMMGLHPTSVDENYKEKLQLIKSLFTQRKYIAVGEVGIDLYWDKTFIKEQIIAFKEQLQWSIDLNLPVIIHTREAFPEVFECIQEVGADRLRGVFHSFGGTREELEQALSFKNFLLGINGVVTFKNSKFRDYLPIAPLNRIVLETDAPYLAPVPYRGKRNEPSYLILVAEKLAEVYNASMKEIAEQTTQNAMELFF